MINARDVKRQHGALNKHNSSIWVCLRDGAPALMMWPTEPIPGYSSLVGVYNEGVLYRQFLDDVRETERAFMRGMGYAA